MKIDFVVLWVDGNEEKWQTKKRKYENVKVVSKLNTNDRYRDYDTLKYWFRSVDKYADWVNHIFLITDNQMPKWLNTKNPKLTLVDHKDFLNINNLPVFNSNAIELNIDKIEGLSDTFVLFNDDMFINKGIKENIFFENGLPRDTGILSPIIPQLGGIGNIINNDLEWINENYSLRSSIKNNFFKYVNIKYGINNIRSLFMMPWHKFPGFFNPHLPTPYLKREFVDARKMAKTSFLSTSSNKFRTTDDISHWIVRYKRLAEGKFNPININKIGKLYDLSEMDSILKDINCSEHSLICINDEDVSHFDDYIAILKKSFEKKYNIKSGFEI